MTLIQLLNHYLYFVAEIVDSSLFGLVFPMFMAFASIFGVVRIIRYIVSLKR